MKTEICHLNRGDYFVWDEHNPDSLHCFLKNEMDESGNILHSWATEVLVPGNEKMATRFPNQMMNWNPCCVIRVVEPDFSALLQQTKYYCPHECCK